ELELMAPVELNIVCFRYRSDDSDRINEQIVIDLQESGIVVPSTTRISGQLTIRAAIVNHRTGRSEIDALIDNTLVLGRASQEKSASSRVAQTAPQIPMHAALQAQLQTIEERLASQPDSVA